jgi:crossover junction endonuclease MUS81
LDVRTPPLLDNERFGDRYDVVCLIDQREYMVRKAGTSAPVVAEFQGKGLICEVRSLELGDFLWIAKERGGTSEYVLDYVCERKRVDDLILSIQSNRSGLEHSVRVPESD